jgi:predicted nucleotidyltransferase
MTPTALRSVLLDYLDGALSLPEYAGGLHALGQSPSVKVQGRVETLLDEIDRLCHVEAIASRWPPSLAVLRGLTGELLDSLPDGNIPPEVGVIIDTLSGLHDGVAAQYGIELIGLGGSSISGNRTLFSDIDVAVKTTRKVSLMDMASATDAVRRALHWPVDLVFLDFAEPEFRDRFECNLIRLKAVAA